MTNQQQTASDTIKLLDIVEATTVNAIAKNAIEFHLSVAPGHGLPAATRIESSLATFDRGISSNESQNEFVVAVRKAGLEIDVIPESFRFDPRVISALRTLARRHAPDIIVTHQVKSHFLIKLSRLPRRCRDRPQLLGRNEPLLRLRRGGGPSLPGGGRVRSVGGGVASPREA